MKYFLLINVKIIYDQEKAFYANLSQKMLNFLIILYFSVFKFPCSADLNMELFL